MKEGSHASQLFLERNHEPLATNMADCFQNSKAMRHHDPTYVNVPKSMIEKPPSCSHDQKPIFGTLT
jgi:hypothetical protein